MNDSNLLPELTDMGPEMLAAIAEFQSMCPVITYDKHVDYTHNGRRVTYSFSSMPHVVETIKEPLKACGLNYIQILNDDNSVTTVLLHKSGQKIYSRFRIEPKDQNPQNVGITISYMKRYALTSLLGLTTDEDPDGVRPEKLPQPKGNSQMPPVSRQTPPTPQKGEEKNASVPRVGTKPSSVPRVGSKPSVGVGQPKEEAKSPLKEPKKIPLPKGKTQAASASQDHNYDDEINACKSHEELTILYGKISKAMGGMPADVRAKFTAQKEKIKS